MGKIIALIWFLSFAAAYGTYLIYMLHMFQLNSYKPVEHLQWVRGNIRRLLIRSLPMLLALIEAVLLSLGGLLAPWGNVLSMPDSGSGLFGMAAIIGLQCAAAARNRPGPAKKPLVYTARVKRLIATTTVISLVVLAVSVHAALLWYFLTPVLLLLMNLVNRPIEQAVNRYYINDAKKILQAMPGLTVIGVTGSYGKTSVKYFLSKLLSTRFNVLHTPGNYNTTLGVVRTVRTDLKAFHDIFVCEMGARQVHDIKEICDLVHPKYGIITAIGEQHLQSFHTIDNIISTKFELADALPEDGIAFLNYDNLHIRERMYEKTTVSYGVEDENIDNYHAFDIEVSKQGTRFQVRDMDGETCEFQTKLLGIHNVENITGAIAVANQLGIPMEELVYPVRQLESVEHRLQLINQGSRIIIDDAYNSNPQGFRAALDVLSGFDAMRILLTPGMVELGSSQYESNKAAGKYAADKCDYAVLVGKEQTLPISEGLKEAGFDEARIFVVGTIQEGFAQIEALQAGEKMKVILMENDLPDNY